MSIEHEQLIPTPRQLRDRNQTELPLWSIATTMILIVVAPLIFTPLYPPAPFERVISCPQNEQQRVSIHRLASSQEIRDEACLLDQNSPLIVVETSTAEGFIAAEAQGSLPTNGSSARHIRWWCSEVVLKPFQVFHKSGLFSAMQSALLRFFRS